MIAYVALGSNLGDRRAHLERGLEGLRRLGPTELSPLVMETPDEAGLGPAYLNTVARLHGKEEDPRRLLEALLRIELAQGRDRKSGRNAPRTLDLDLIAVEGLRGSWTWPAPSDLASYWGELTLTLPHPRAHNRSFVTEPLKALGTDPDGLV